MERRWMVALGIAAGCVALSVPAEAKQGRNAQASGERSASFPTREASRDLRERNWRQQARREARLNAIAAENPAAQFTKETLPKSYTYTLPNHAKARAREARLRTKAADGNLAESQRARALERADLIASHIEAKDVARIQAIGNPLVGRAMEQRQRALEAKLVGADLSDGQRAKVQGKLDAVNAKVDQRQLKRLNRPTPHFKDLRGSGNMPDLHKKRDRAVEYDRMDQTATIKPRHP